MDSKILQAASLDNLLTAVDKENIVKMNILYDDVLKAVKAYGSPENPLPRDDFEKRLIALYGNMGDLMQQLLKQESRIHVYSFDTPKQTHGEVSRIIAKLRDKNTEREEFIYYIQRAYEMLFNFAYGSIVGEKKNYLIVETPVTAPLPNFAVHKIPDIDNEIKNSVMCVMLRGALLPCMIMSKEIEEYSTPKYVTPFMLFNIHRDDSKKEHEMHYILDLESSYYDLDAMQGKDLIFADPMNATGGSLVTIIKFLEEKGVVPRSIKFFNIVSSLKASLRIARAVSNVDVYTLWMDPGLNTKAYILPGLGNVGDRINGPYKEGASRNIIQLLADYGSHITGLYRSQLEEIERIVL
ncbi:MAG: uracil phosphoribosyltransferase [Spirochaetaceae bacterium]|nr:MAG: uracil phosphoribosyltransferase [Spirochaetaceae bacterium]